MQLKPFHPIGHRSLSLTYPGRRDNHRCLIRLLRITPTNIFCFCHMDALGEVLRALSILVQSAPTRVRGNLYPDEQKERWELRTFYAYPARRSACFSPCG